MLYRVKDNGFNLCFVVELTVREREDIDKGGRLVIDRSGAKVERRPWPDGNTFRKEGGGNVSEKVQA